MFVAEGFALTKPMLAAPHRVTNFPWPLIVISMEYFKGEIVLFVVRVAVSRPVVRDCFAPALTNYRTDNFLSYQSLSY